MEVDWKIMAIATFCLLAGVFTGRQMASEDMASGMAEATCGICQDNLGIMVQNFNLLARECSVKNPYMKYSLGDLNSTPLQ